MLLQGKARATKLGKKNPKKFKKSVDKPKALCYNRIVKRKAKNKKNKKKTLDK